ncbi:MAG: hypothetical protein ABSG91_12295 [Syntrophobacteraceae bacterium]|jgi:hypothetical protein
MPKLIPSGKFLEDIEAFKPQKDIIKKVEAHSRRRRFCRQDSGQALTQTAFFQGHLSEDPALLLTPNLAWNPALQIGPAASSCCACRPMTISINGHAGDACDFD